MRKTQFNHSINALINYFFNTKLVEFLKKFGALVLFLTILHQIENEKKDGNVCLNEVAYKCQKVKMATD